MSNTAIIDNALVPQINESVKTDNPTLGSTNSVNEQQTIAQARRVEGYSENVSGHVPLDGNQLELSQRGTTTGYDFSSNSANTGDSYYDVDLRISPQANSTRTSGYDTVITLDNHQNGGGEAPYVYVKEDENGQIVDAVQLSYLKPRIEANVNIGRREGDLTNYTTHKLAVEGEGETRLTLPNFDARGAYVSVDFENTNDEVSFAQQQELIGQGYRRLSADELNNYDLPSVAVWPAPGEI
jgi:hypothetical protein